ncbi:hypothetical protein RhiirC2_856052 [Rhizophagus irregularis]|uniref:Uncharacterized protein n=1 Tax=Rhizophagus irregularis TaxID=588596 RepID=A0A2N1MJH2_9GLOM|nr:hypothetical protein RhiirC2_856052 [Rhizophagus irregularis]
MVGLFDLKEVLYENGIFTSSPTSKPLFSYTSFCKVLSELFNKSSKDKNLENLNEASIDIVHRWAKQMIKNHKTEDYYDNELFEDPLLLIEWFIGNKIKKSTTYQNNSCYCMCIT